LNAQIKTEAIAFFAALAPQNQAALLSGGKKAIPTNGADAVASASSPKPTPTTKPAAADKKADTPTPKPKKEKVDKVKTAEELAAEAEKAREKAAREAEKEQRRKERDDKAAEKAREKVKKEDEKRKKEEEKADKEQKVSQPRLWIAGCASRGADSCDGVGFQIKDELARREALANSQKSLMSSFFTKKPSPATSTAVHGQ